MMELVFFLTKVDTAKELCAEMSPILRIVGIVVLGIKIVVPIILIIIGMIDLGKAVAEKEENKIKEAQNRLVKRAIAAVLVFLVATIVSIIVQAIVGSKEYKYCWDCINHPFSKEYCKNWDLE